MSLQTQTGALDRFINHPKKPKNCKECKSWKLGRCNLGYQTSAFSPVCRQAN